MPVTFTYQKSGSGEGGPEAPKKDEKSFEEKTLFIMDVVETFAIKAFAGYIAYVLVDTRRKVKVARAGAPVYRRY